MDKHNLMTASREDRDRYGGGPSGGGAARRTRMQMGGNRGGPGDWDRMH